MGLRFNAFVTLPFWLLYITGTSDVHFGVAIRRRHSPALGARTSAIGTEALNQAGHERECRRHLTLTKPGRYPPITRPTYAAPNRNHLRTPTRIVFEEVALAVRFGRLAGLTAICATLRSPLRSAGHPGGRLHAAGRHAVDPHRRRHLHRLHRHREAQEHGCRRQRVHAELLQRRPRVHQRHRQHLAPRRVPHHPGHHARDRHRQLAERQLHVPPEVCLRAVQPGSVDDRAAPGCGWACSRRRGSTSKRASTAIGSRARYSRSARASCRRPTLGRRSTTTSSATTATIHGGVYNGENYNRSEANDQKGVPWFAARSGRCRRARVPRAFE